jgi:predicted nucleic acid-binding protein
MADKSAWCRAKDPAVAQEWSAAVLNNQIATCAISKLEILFSARTSAEYEDWADSLSVLRDIPITRSICASALAGMAQLAARSDGAHRLSIPDYLIAAAAEDAGIGILHYDKHYDRLAAVFGFESRWIAPAGDLD